MVDKTLKLIYNNKGQAMHQERNMYNMKEETIAKLKDIFEWGYCIIIAVALALLIRYYIGTPTIVQQTSMFPTFKQGERLILNRIYRTKNSIPQRGEVITFEAPSLGYVEPEEADLNNPVAKYEYNHNSWFSKFVYNVLEIGKTSYIKRVIALPGEHLEIKDGIVYINGEELKEEYLSENVVTDHTDGAFTDIIVPEGTVFVMGDNRGHSSDSRRFGCIPYEKIESKVWLRFWPLNQFGIIKN